MLNLILEPMQPRHTVDLRNMVLLSSLLLLITLRHPHTMPDHMHLLLAHHPAQADMHLLPALPPSSRKFTREDGTAWTLHTCRVGLL